MNVQSTEQVSFDLSQFMDVVTVYKCKFCDFSCNEPQGIGLHVQQSHTVTQSYKQDGSTTGHVVIDTIPSADQPTTSHEMAGSSQAEVSFMSSGTQATSTSASINNDPALLQSHDVDTSIGQSILSDSAEMPEVDNEIDAVDRIIEAANVDSGIDVTDDASGPMTINKEIYLCGQCNLGFDSMENCKNHMIEDHNVSADSQEIVNSSEANSPALHSNNHVSTGNKVSVGTQVTTHKKPGRKRKAKEDPKPQPSVEDEFEEEMALEDDEHRGVAKRRAIVNDDGELQVIEEPDENVEGRRRRRLPARLASLYYLGRRHTIARSPVKNHPPPPPKIKHEPHKLKCLKVGCTARFRNEASLDLHMACHKTPDELGGRQVFACPKCEMTDPQWKVLRMHLWKAHSIDTDLYACTKCEFRIDTVSRLERHIQSHSDQRPYSCDMCEKSFKQPGQLQNHKAIHQARANPEKSTANSRVCDICKRTFVSQKCLKMHMETVHSKERPYVCPYCNHATSRKAILDLHVRTHTGEKPYKCDMCTYMTGDHNSLRRHKMRHTGEKPYKCRYCPYSAIQAISLKTHMKNKHPGYEGVFACNLCQYQTVNQQYYTQHMMDHSNGLIPTVRTTQPQAGAGMPVARATRGGQSLIRPNVAAAVAQPAAQPQLITLDDGRQALAIHAPNVAAAAAAFQQQQEQQQQEQQQHQQQQQLQQSNNTPTAVINQADLNKLTNLGVLQDGTDAAQLIYTALSALQAQNQSREDHSSGPAEGSSAGVGGIQPEQVLLGGAQPTVHSTTHGGVTTHTITFHIPPNNTIQQQPAEQLQVVEPEGETEIVSTSAVVEEQQHQHQASVIKEEVAATTQLVQMEDEDGQIIYQVHPGSQDDDQHSDQPHQIVFNTNGEVTYAEVIPEGATLEEAVTTHEVVQASEVQSLEEQAEQLVLEVASGAHDNMKTETVVPIEVSAYEATPTEEGTTTIVEGDDVNCTEIVTTEVPVSSIVQNPMEVMSAGGEVPTLVMEVMGEDGKPTQVEYITCAIAEES